MALTNSIKDFSENHEDVDQIADEAISFGVKFLGSQQIESSRSEQQTSDAVKSIITTAKATTGKKFQRVSLSISPKGIEMTDNITGERLLQVSIYQISFCSADATHNHVFAFIASENEPKLDDAKKPDAKSSERGLFSLNPLAAKNNESEENLICYAFLCQKRKMAQTVTLTVARAFERAYQIWQNQQFQMEKKQAIRQDKENVDERAVQPKEDDGVGKSLLIDLDSDAITLDLYQRDGRDYLQNTWVSFDDDVHNTLESTAILPRLSNWDREHRDVVYS